MVCVCLCVWQAALRLGLSHAPLATSALDALESWSSSISPSIIQPHYMDILPHLDGYLKTGTSNGENPPFQHERKLCHAVLLLDCKRSSSVYVKINRLYTIDHLCCNLSRLR